MSTLSFAVKRNPRYIQPLQENENGWGGRKSKDG